MSADNQPAEVIQVSGTTTHTGWHRVFWMNIAATVDATVSISDDTTELVRFIVQKEVSRFIQFRPSIVCKTSFVITLVAGTAEITTSHRGG